MNIGIINHKNIMKDSSDISGLDENNKHQVKHFVIKKAVIKYHIFTTRIFLMLDFKALAILEQGSYMDMTLY